MYALLSSANLIPGFIAFDSWYLLEVNTIGFFLSLNPCKIDGQKYL